MMRKSLAPLFFGLATTGCLSAADYEEMRNRDPLGWAARQCEYAAKDRVVDMGGGNPIASGGYVDHRGSTYTFRGQVEYRAPRRSRSDPPEESKRPHHSIRYWCMVRDGEVVELNLGSL